MEAFETHYTSAKRVTSFQKHYNLYGLGNKGGFILEACFEGEHANTVTPYDSPNPFFYLHLLIIQDLKVLISFTLFKYEVPTIIIVGKSKIMPNN